MTGQTTTEKPLPSREPAELRTLIDQALDELLRLLPLLEALTNSRQRGLGFLTPVGRRIMDEQLRKENRERIRNVKDGVEITGAVPAPVNIAAVSLAGEIAFTLGHLSARLRRQLAAVGVCPAVKPPPQEHTTRQVLADCRALAGLIVRKKLLLDIVRDLADLTERTRQLVHGNDRLEHDRPCPYCGRNTLVVYLTDGIIRCERDPHTGEYEPCICDDSYCDCKTVGTHHEWYRDRKRAAPSQRNSWHGLKRDQDRAERAHHNEPKEHTP